MKAFKPSQQMDQSIINKCNAIIGEGLVGSKQNGKIYMLFCFALPSFSSSTAAASTSANMMRMKKQVEIKIRPGKGKSIQVFMKR